MDQWILHTHYKVKQQIHKNIAMTRMFSRLENKHQLTIFESLLKLNAYSYRVKRRTEGKFSAKSKFKDLIEKLTRACDIKSRILNRKKRQNLVKYLNKWKLEALFIMSKEAMQQNMINSHRENVKN